MSISGEKASRYQNEPAVVCCRQESGQILGAEHLEDPVIIPDLVDSGILTLDHCLTIGQVLGKKLTKTLDPLTPVTPDVLEETIILEKEDIHLGTGGPTKGAKYLRLNIGRGENISFEIPIEFFDMNVKGVQGLTPVLSTASNESLLRADLVEDEERVMSDRSRQKRVKRSLIIRQVTVHQVVLGKATVWKDGTLTIDEGLALKAIEFDPLVKNVTIDVINPGDRDQETDTIMDVIPIAAKVQGELGEGVTNVFQGVVVILTGVDEDGKQIGEFGSSAGKLSERIKFGRPGAPDHEDIIIRVRVVIAAGTGMERQGPYATHKATDYIIQNVREYLKKLGPENAGDEKEYHDVDRPGRPRVLIVKEIMGQGAMHDNIILPKEPAGVIEGRPNVDLGNLPVLLTPNEVRDGGIHALVCVGPASKETTRHYFREPLVEELASDEELNLIGVIFVGSPQANQEKFYVSRRLGALIEAMDVDGVIITTEGFGNNHIDFASHIEQIGKRGIPVVGMTYSSVQGALIIGNRYMDALVDLNKSETGGETEVLAENTLCPDDARRAAAMLKNKIAGMEILAPARRWSKEVLIHNQALVNGRGQSGNG